MPGIKSFRKCLGFVRYQSVHFWCAHLTTFRMGLVSTETNRQQIAHESIVLSAMQTHPNICNLDANADSPFWEKKPSSQGQETHSIGSKCTAPTCDRVWRDADSTGICAVPYSSGQGLKRSIIPQPPPPPSSPSAVHRRAKYRKRTRGQARWYAQCACGMCTCGVERGQQLWHITGML